MIADQIRPTAQGADGAAVHKNGEAIAEHSDTRIGVLGNGFPIFMNGCAIRALCRWSDLIGDHEYLDTAGGLAHFGLQARFWQPEASPKAVVAAGHGQFTGHTHSYT